MVLWRLSGAPHARALNGGYGLLYGGRWNSAGRAVTYCSTSPSLCVLEKLVHVEDPALLPALLMVRYDVPDELEIEAVLLKDLPKSWRLSENLTQERGDRWHAELRSPLLQVPSSIVPIDGSPDQNFLINHRHPAAAHISIISVDPFVFDVRLF
jgi:RES domain-containing protein